MIATILDCGNQSFDVTSMNVWQQLRRHLDHPLPLVEYNRSIRGVGGAMVKCYGRSSHPILVTIPGLPSPQACYPVVIQANSFHFNYALSSLKNNSLSLHFSPTSHTIVECRESGHRVSLSKRDSIRAHQPEHSAHQICELLNVYSKAQPTSDLLMEINVLHQSLLPRLSGHQVLIERQDSFKIAEDLISAQSDACEELSSQDFQVPSLVEKCKYKLLHSTGWIQTLNFYFSDFI